MRLARTTPDEIDFLSLAAGEAREKLQSATAQAKAGCRAAMAAQLAPALDGLIAGLEAAAAVERLLGRTGLYSDVQSENKRQLVYLKALRARLLDED